MEKFDRSKGQPVAIIFLDDEKPQQKPLMVPALILLSLVMLFLLLFLTMGWRPAMATLVTSDDNAFLSAVVDVLEEQNVNYELDDSNHPVQIKVAREDLPRIELAQLRNRSLRADSSGTERMLN